MPPPASSLASRRPSPHWSRYGRSELRLRVGVLAVPWLLVALGGQWPWALAVAAVLLAVGLGPALAEARSAPLLLKVLGALAAFTALQAVPLPLAWLAQVSPASAAVWARALTPLKGGVTWAPLSLDPGATLVEAVKLLVYAAVFVVAGAWAQRHGRARVVLAAAGCGVLAALATLAHGALGAERVWGLYAPQFAGPPLVGPLLNPNNLAGYLGFTALASAGGALRSRGARRWGLWGVAVGLAGGVVLTGSRGGVGALLVGAACLGLLRLEAASRKRRAAVSGLLGGAALLASVLVVVALFNGAGLSGLGQQGLDKLRVFERVAPMLRDHLWWGVGRGAFESAFARYGVTDGRAVYSHPENFLAQWVTEWGLPAGVLAALALAWALRPRAWGAHQSPAAAGVWAGLATLTVQNWVDLSSEVPAVMALLFAGLGACWGGLRQPGRQGPSSSSAGARRRPPEPAPARRWLAAAFLGLCLIMAWRGRHTLGADRRALWEAAQAPDALDGVRLSTLREQLAAALARHPAEPYFPRLGAELALRARDQSPLPWLQRALELDERSPETQLLLARHLVRRGALGQGLSSLRRATAAQPSLAARVSRIALGWTQEPAQLARVAPHDAGGAAVLLTLERTGRTVLGVSARDALLRRALELSPGDPAVLEARAALWLQSCRPAAPDCLAAATAAVAALRRQVGAPLPQEAELAALGGDPQGALNTLLELCPGASDPGACLARAVELAAATGESATLRQVGTLYLRHHCVDAEPCARANERLAQLYATAAHPALAVHHAQAAAQASPTLRRWQLLARLARQAGETALAERAAERAAQYGGP